MLLFKYFLHGILFSALLTVLVVGWALLAFVLVICGFIIGLIIAIILYVAMFGWLNTKITGWLWFEVETGFGTYLLHGLLLLIALFVAGLVPLAVGYVAAILGVSMLGTAILMFFVWAPVDGYIAKAVARIWERPAEPELPPEDLDSGQPPVWGGGARAVTDPGRDDPLSLGRRT